MKYQILLSAFLLLSPLLVQAEYRVFLLNISRKPSSTEAPAEPRQVLSTLDPIQYRYYYPVAADEVISYTKTWRCKGRTDDFKDFCPNPKDQNPSNEQPTP